MRLRSLEIQGFKSFPDKTRLEFGDGITAVVGPNGSGKSNIADAVRWVLGEQSTKNLRGSKMEDVIFGGTQTRKAQGYAMVQLTIDNIDRALPYDEDLLTISRRLYRSGESEYRIAGNMVRLKDIHQLFMDTGLGRDGYSIIGQGRIAEIVSAKSKERREIFEEAAGIAKFRYRKEEAEKKLAAAEENLVRLRDILGELEERVGPLRQQAEKAKEFLALSGEKRGLEISLWLLELSALKTQLSQQDDKIYICKNQYQQFELESSKLEEEMAAVYQKSQQLSMQAEAKRSQIKQLEDRLSKGEAESAVLQNDIHHNSLSIRRLQGELGDAGSDREQIARRLEEKEKEYAAALEGLSAMAGRIEAAQQRLTEQREQAVRVEGEIARLSTQMGTLATALAQQQLTMATNETLRSESKNRMQVLEQSSTAQNDAVAEIQAALEECSTQLEEQQGRAHQLQNALKGYQMKRDSRTESCEKLRKERQELENQIIQKLQRAKLLEDLEKSMEGFAHSVKYILGEANKGALGGVLGAVSSLIRVPEAYALAIETALGGAMQHIVVKDEEIAKRAISLLKNKGVGRATFLPISAVKGKVMDDAQVGKQEGFVGIASRLVEADSQYSGILAQLLGRVCIVEDLDAGTRIAKSTGYSFRIVTLDGQVINAGGSYTGGSTSKGTGVLGRRGEIEKLRQQAQEAKQDLAALDAKLKSAQEDLAALEAYLAGAVSEIQTTREETVRLGLSQDQLEKNLTQAQENKRLAAQELDRLTKRLEELHQTELTAGQVMEELSAQLQELDAQIAGVTARKDILAEGTANAGEMLSQLRMDELSAQKDTDALAAEIRTVREQIESFGDRARQLQEEITRLEGQNTVILTQIDALAAEKIQLQENIAQYNAGIVSYQDQRTALEAETTALRQRERETAGQREGISRELARLEERRNTLQGDCDSIITRLWDEYELTRSKAAEEAVEIPDREKASRRLNELRGKIKGLGTVNVAAVEEYAQVNQRYEFLSAQVTDVEESKAQIFGLIQDLTQEMRDLFTDNFFKIGDHFSRIFVQLFGGGKGELTLSQGEDVLEAGVDIFVQPPGKIIKNLASLSGGEQAFVAIAIYFAILKVRPAPFCLLDEIEAALDDVNVNKFAAYLRQMSDNTQFIAITHRRGTMEEADALYGVTMQDEGVSKLLELKVTEVESKLGI